ncbi:arsenate reductase ArsC [Microbacterium koreense]|uniref:Arsenate reductase ArsC n=1 Tax=Microbacterium koreense TaxID=323761 RepID=A0ABW2ZQE3_9MICO
MPPTNHRVGQPLDPAQAASRAAQAAALGDPVNLRILSALAAGVLADDLARELTLDDERVRQGVAELAAVDVIHDDGGMWTLTADAWVRFGRLLVGSEEFRGRETPRHVVALPMAVESVARDLAYRFASTFSAETVSRYVAESYLLLDQRSRVRTHLPTLTARYAAERLDALASASGLVLRGTPEVLFVCVQNAGRSQLAAAYLRHLAGTAVHVRTAGSAPAAAVSPRIVEALAEQGVPFADEYPKPLTDEVVQAADYVITMGCGDACPVYPGRRYLDWDLEDPLTQDDAGLRRVRDQIRERVVDLIARL